MNTTNAQHLPSIEEFKQQARELKKSQNFEKLGHAQNALAKEYGYKDYRAIKSTLKSDNVQNNCKNRSELDTNVGVRPDAKTEFNRTVKRS